MKYYFLLVLFFLAACKSEKILAQQDQGCKLYYDSSLKTNVYTLTDTWPEFPGGGSALLGYFAKTIVYPSDQEELQLSINVEFVINTSGLPVNIKIAIKEVNEYSKLDLEMIKAVKQMPRWTPGKYKGKKVAFLVRYPLKY